MNPLRANSGPAVALVTGRADLQAVVRVAAAAARTDLAMVTPASVGAVWSSFDSILLGADAVAVARPLTGARNGPRRVAVVDGPGRGDLGDGLPGATAMSLPDDRGHLATWLSGTPGPSGPGAIAVIGGRGGAGASTAAVALVRAAARRSGEAVIVDADPLGGGLDLALGAESLPGARWPDLAELGGSMVAHWLLAALPRVQGISVVAHSRGRDGGAGQHTPGPPGCDVGPDTIAAVLDACIARLPTVVDLPRHDSPVVRTVLSRCATLIVVVPAEIRACAAAAAVVDVLGEGITDVRLLVRGPSPAGLDAEDIAEAVGVATFAEIRAEPGLAGATERGDPVAVAGRSPLRRWADGMAASVVHPAATHGAQVWGG